MTGTLPPLIANLQRGWAGDCDLLVAQYVEDCRFEDKAFGVVHEGHAGIREVFDFSFSLMPDFRVEYRRWTLNDDAGAAEWVFTGSFHGEHDGTKHEGTPVRLEGLSFMTFRDGRIVTNTDYSNMAALSAQLGPSR
ncbi:nuclear transport factor 2 family protein [Patulibacter minatonensis]|uniref:nuclear transport factor 2 family protein n=1 Tax=Patulibacter minatonensis TaxID=298163 RepID=UPI0004797A55|nr:ester cyclase [Patulibacter minatonensis]